jgi:hypothetical protein
MELIVIGTTLALSIGVGLTAAYAVMSTIFFVMARAIVRSGLPETNASNTSSRIVVASRDARAVATPAT